VYRRLDFVESPLIDLFAKGAQNLAPLPREKNTIWDPEKVLLWITGQDLPSSFLQSAREAAILLLLATGWRVDDLWKLKNLVKFSDGNAVFFFAERRKCKKKANSRFPNRFFVFQKT
jgi:hypothetical protein